MKTWASCLRKTMSFCVLADYHDLFILLVVCPGHLLTEAKPHVNWTFHHIQWPALYFLYFHKKLLHTQTAECSVPQAHQGQKYEFLGIWTFSSKCCGQHIHKALTTKLTTNFCPGTVTVAHRVILVSWNHLEDRKVPTQMKVKRCELNWIDVCRCYPDSLSHR